MILDESLYDIISEDSMKAKERNSLSDNEFGIPSTRSFPLNDKAHVKAAIRMFNHVDKAHEAELAKNILKKMKKYNLSTENISSDNRLSNYIDNKNEDEMYDTLFIK